MARISGLCGRPDRVHGHRRVLRMLQKEQLHYGELSDGWEKDGRPSRFSVAHLRMVTIYLFQTKVIHKLQDFTIFV